MSGKHYGAIHVHQEADKKVDETSTTSGGNISERLPLLLSSAVSSTRKSTSSKSVTTKQIQPHWANSQLWSDTTFNWISPLLVTGNAKVS
jgi:hypothetical protein